jgi:Rne/Rng family ribonuclease
MSKELFVASSPHETKVAVLEDDQLVEVYFERDTDVGLVGGIYKGRVSRVLPGMQSAFVDIGLERDAFLYVSDFFSEDAEEYDKVFDEAEARVTRFMAAETSASPSTAVPPAGAAPGANPISRATSDQTPVATTSTPVVDDSAPSAPLPASPITPAVPIPVHVGWSPEGPRAATWQPGDPSSPRHHDSRGRRRRGRGGNFRNSRTAPKPDFRGRPPVRPERNDSAPHTFELLPGESLAKYRKSVPAAPVPASSDVTSDRSVTPATDIASAADRAVENSIAAEPSYPFPATAADLRFEEDRTTVSPDLSHSGFQPDDTPLAIFDSVGVAEPPEIALSSDAPKADAWQSGPALEAEDSVPPIDASTQFSQDPRAGAAPLPEPNGVPLRTGEIEEVPERMERPDIVPQVVGEAEIHPKTPPITQAPPKEPSSGPAERSYTLREPQQRPRFAPRRGRRGRRPMDQRGPQPEGGQNSERPGAQPLQISEMLKEGQEILVQIAKEPLGTKGARITSHVALPGRYLVYMPTIDHIGVSRKIPSEQERLRLRNTILENKGSLTGGFIVRTAGAGRSPEEFKADLKFLSTLWDGIRTKAASTRAPALIHRDLDLVQRLLRDLLSPDFKSVRVDNETEYERVMDFVSRCQPSLAEKVRLYSRETPLFEEFGIHAEIEKALKPKIWLKSGGYIVINQTEALVAIDVNTGKYVGKTNRLEDTILKTNVDAVNEIVRQIRLRDLGGIIVIDFIDMEERRNRNRVGQALEEALRRDRAPTKILAFNDFGLVAITRKRVKQSLERTLCEPCGNCSGSGWIKSVVTICYEILTEVRKMAGQIEGKTLTLRVSPEVARVLKSRDGVLISEIESMTHKDVVIKSDPAVHQERFEIF